MNSVDSVRVIFCFSGFNKEQQKIIIDSKPPRPNDKGGIDEFVSKVQPKLKNLGAQIDLSAVDKILLKANKKAKQLKPKKIVRRLDKIKIDRRLNHSYHQSVFAH